MPKTVYMQVMLKTTTIYRDPPAFRLELAREPVPAPVEQPRGLLGWLFGRPRVEHQPTPLQIPWSPDANFAGGYSALPNPVITEKRR